MAFDTGVRIGRYEIGRKLGQGGFGILYAARDHELGRDIAIKFLRPEHVFKPQVVQRFLQEARAAARISHPGIVTVYDSGEVSGTHTRADGTVYIAMELLAGDTLAHRLKQSGTMPYRMALGFCRQMATALGAAHAAGIVHRDLKPQNIFLVPDPAVLGGERVKVLDFGIAKLIDDMGSAINTHSMLMLGTPMYMSPEQCRSSAKVDARSDIYALGCMLFEMVTGKTPFEGDSGELIAKHQLVPPPSARSINPSLPIVLDQLISAMLAKNPDERPQTMASVLDVLEECDERSVEPLTRPDAAPLRPGAMMDLSPTHSSTTVSDGAVARAKRRRMPIVFGAAGLVVIAVTIGVCSTRDDGSKRAAATVTTADAAAAESSELVKDLKLECLQAQIEKHWSDLRSCGLRLADISREEGGKFVVMAEAELDNEAALRRLQDAVKRKDVAGAKTALDEIEEESVYYGLARSEFTAAQPNAPPPVVAAERPPAPAPPVAKQTVIPPVRAVDTAPSGCNADALKDKGMEAINLGQHAAALASFEASLRCKRDSYVIQLAFMEACASANGTKAKLYFKQMTSAQQAKFAQICIRMKTPYQ